jgi:hypothetical protein
MVTVLAPLGSTPRPQKRRYEYDHRRRVNPATQKQAIENVWSCGSAKEEAAMLFAFMKRNGSSIAEMRELICVSDFEFDELNNWANQNPALVASLDRVMDYRQKVLEAFDRLCERRGESQCLESTSAK